jgi:hypothetical protein
VTAGAEQAPARLVTDPLQLAADLPLSEDEAGYVAAARAPNTLRGYRSDWAGGSGRLPLLTGRSTGPSLIPAVFQVRVCGQAVRTSISSGGISGVACSAGARDSVHYPG